jgi:glycosyltransferase involved in cell wall biosynthesis
VTPARRILFVHQLLGAFGGAERYLELLLPALRERGVECGVALFGRRTMKSEALLARVRAAFDPFHVDDGPATPWSIRRALRATRSELLHWNMPEPFLFRGALLSALPWGVPSVLTDHLPMMRNGVHYELVRKLANLRLAGIVVVSESAAAEARAHWTRLPPLAVVRNGVEVGGSAVRRPRDGEPVRLLFVGRLEQQKNPLFALEVLAAVRKRGIAASLDFVGEGSLASEIQRRAAELGLEDAAELLGFADDPTGYLLDAHLLLAPGEFEGMPLAPIEALAAGLPVLSSDIAPHLELARECAALAALPVSRGADAWADEIERLLPELERLSALAVGARERFSVARMADETLGAYDLFLR